MTITLTRDEAQQVLDALNDVRYRIEFGQMNLSDDTDAAIETLRARLAQPEPEPQEVIAKWIKTNTEHREWYICPKCSHQTPRFKDEWQGLTDEERLRCFDDVDWNKVDWCPDHEQYAKAIEAKLKEKNT
jgi:hypothetical protein